MKNWLPLIGFLAISTTGFSSAFAAKRCVGVGGNINGNSFILTLSESSALASHNSNPDQNNGLVPNGSYRSLRSQNAEVLIFDASSLSGDGDELVLRVDRKLLSSGTAGHLVVHSSYGEPDLVYICQDVSY